MVWLQKCKSLYFLFYLHFPSVYGILYFLVRGSFIKFIFISPQNMLHQGNSFHKFYPIWPLKSPYWDCGLNKNDNKHAGTFYMFPITDSLIDSVPITVTVILYQVEQYSLTLILNVYICFLLSQRFLLLGYQLFYWWK